MKKQFNQTKILFPDLLLKDKEYMQNYIEETFNWLEISIKQKNNKLSKQYCEQAKVLFNQYIKTHG